MDRAETLKIMAVLRGAYPQFYRNIDRTEAENTVNLWLDLFAGEPYPLVAAAVKSFISADEKGFPPVPGQIMGKLRLLTDNREMTEADAWGIVSKALKNGYYGAEEEFEKLPPVIKRLVGSPSQLRDWAVMDSGTVQSVVASNFQRSYKIVAARERETAKLPADVKKLLDGLSTRMSLDAPDRLALEEVRPYDQRGD